LQPGDISGREVARDPIAGFWNGKSVQLGAKRSFISRFLRRNQVLELLPEPIR